MSAIAARRGEKTISGALALGMHLLFAVLLVFGVTWQQRRTEAPVTVDLWSNLPPQPKAEPPPPPEVKPEPEPPKPPPPKVEPKAEPKPVPKPDIALREKAEKERKRKEEEKAEERKRQEEEKKKLEAKKREEEKKRLAALKEQQAAEARRKEQEEAQRKFAAERAAQATTQQRLIDDYKRRISDKIRRYVVLPPNLQGNPEAEFEVVQIPGGEVLSVKLRRSSGNSAYDAAVERAIHKAQPLPPPPEPYKYGDFREFNLKFRPIE